MKPQAKIVETTSPTQYNITIEREGNTETVSITFTHYQDALDYILKQGWQLKREAPSNSLHVETRFLKP